MNILLGKTIVKMDIAKDKKALRFHIDGGEPVVAKVYGDCCSSTWIEHVELPALGFPAVVTKVDDVPMPASPYDESEYECLSFYGFQISTDKGTILIDYRNESNGYYGGNIWFPDADPEAYNHYYGGVYGQNESKEEWVPLDKDI